MDDPILISLLIFAIVIAASVAAIILLLRCFLQWLNKS